MTAMADTMSFLFVAGIIIGIIIISGLISRNRNRKKAMVEFRDWKSLSKRYSSYEKHDNKKL